MNGNKRSVRDRETRMRRMIYAAMYLAIAMVLPFVTGQIPRFGAMLSPMHIPVLLCGFVCGWPWGLATGLVSPLLRSALFGMPALFPTAVAMTFELGTYGLVSGLLHRVLPRRRAGVYATLVLSMLAGRAVWGTAMLVIAGASSIEFGWEAFLAGAFANALPGIALQLVLIPVIVIAMERAGLVPDRPAPGEA